MNVKKYTIEELREAIKSSNNWSEAIRKIGFKDLKSCNITNIRKISDENSIDYSHFPHNGKKRNQVHNIQVYLNNEKPIHSSGLRKRLIKEGYKTHKCEGRNCGITEWKGESIKLELHHVDGNNQNNNLSNLQILCPNCHSQTENFCGANKKKSQRQRVSDEEMIGAIKTSYCRREALLKVGLTGYGGSYERINKIIAQYGVSFINKPLTDEQLNRLKQIELIKEKYNDSEYLNSYRDKNIKGDPEWRTKPKPWTRKVERPSRDELIKLLYDKPMVIIAKELGVCDQSIKNWMRWYKIEIPPQLGRGYWRKVECGKIPKVPCPI